MKRLVILNPISRGGRAAVAFAEMQSQLKSRLGDFELYQTTARLDATHKVRAVLKKNAPDQILVAGGDGTVNEVVNGYFENGRILNRTTGLGIINLGSGGDLFRAIGQMSPDYDHAILQNRTTKADCGKITLGDQSKYFMNIASAGVAGQIMYSREMSRFKAGTIAYLYHTLKSIIAYKPEQMVIRYTAESGENQTLTVHPLNFFACNGRFNGAGMNWAPQASLEDGLFDVVLIAGVSKLKMILKSNLVYAGRVQEFPGIKQFRASKVSFEIEREILGEADGEIYACKPGIVTYEIIPGAIPLVL